jgi:hypothetical protein
MCPATPAAGDAPPLRSARSPTARAHPPEGSPRSWLPLSFQTPPDRSFVKIRRDFQQQRPEPVKRPPKQQKPRERHHRAPDPRQIAPGSVRQGGVRGGPRKTTGAQHTAGVFAHALAAKGPAAVRAARHRFAIRVPGAPPGLHAARRIHVERRNGRRQRRRHISLPRVGTKEEEAPQQAQPAAARPVPDPPGRLRSPVGSAREISAPAAIAPRPRPAPSALP